jgi:hypothetical protein
VALVAEVMRDAQRFAAVALVRGEELGQLEPLRRGRAGRSGPGSDPRRSALPG